MRMARLLMASFGGLMVSAALIGTAYADGPAPPAPLTDVPATQPADLAGYADLIKKCTDYDRISSNWKWSTIYTADFRPGQPVSWHPDDQSTDQSGQPNSAFVQASIINDQGHDVLLLNGQMCMFTFLDIGPKVRGDMAIEMTCKNVGPRRCDLSLLLGGLHSGPGFQFGSYDDTKAVIFTGIGANDNPACPAGQPIDCKGQPQTFQANQWYHVRLEVKDGQVRGLVDGHEVGKVGLNPRFPLDEAHQPIVYCYNSQMVIRELHIEAYGRDTRGVDPAAWSRVFGNTEPAEVQKQLDGLTAFLADRDAATRERAERILTDLGELAIPALERASTTDVPELTIRAASILQNLRASGRAPGHD